MTNADDTSKTSNPSLEEMFRTEPEQDQGVREYYMQGAARRRGFVLEKSHDGMTWSITPGVGWTGATGKIAASIVGEGLSLEEVEARLVEEMTEEQANEGGIFDCPTCGLTRDAVEMGTDEAYGWAVERGVKIVGTRHQAATS